MKPQEVKRFIDVLAKIGYNCIELYTEDTYEVKDEPYLGFMRGRYTSAEIKEIDEYAKSKGIELIPCIQTLAHFDAATKNFALRDLWDIAPILLCDEERTYEFLDRCFASLAEKFSSRRVNIGMDEARMLGLGKYLRKHGYTDKLDLLSRHLSKVVEIAEKYGFKPHMWSDMFFRPINNGAYYGKDLHIPEHIRKLLPENIEITYWDYNSSDSEIYDSMFAAHVETGKPVWFAGGAWSWCGFAPFNRFSQEHLKLAMQSARKYSVQNVLITMWGDSGAECSRYALLPTLYAARQYADGNYDEESIKAGFEKAIGVPYDSFMALDLPNEFATYKPNVTGYPENPSKWLLYQDAFQGKYDADLAKRGEIDYAAYAKKLYALSDTAKEYGYVFKTLADLCSVLELKSKLGLRTRAAYAANDKAALQELVKEYLETASRVRVLYKSFFAQWHKENKAFGWEVQDLRLGGLERRLTTCAEMLTGYLTGEIERLEELEETPLVTERPDLHEKNYEIIVTAGRLS